MLCNICKNETNYIFSSKIMGKKNIKYFQCPSCYFIQTEKPTWLNEAYSSAIATSDLTIIERGFKNAII